MAAATRPPGPRGQFLVGTGLEFGRDPLGFLTRCRGYGDLVRVRFLHIPVFMIHSPALIETVLVGDSSKYVKSMDLRESRNVLGNGLLTSEGAFWRRQRGLAQPAFHRERIAGYARVITDFAEQMLSTWKEGEARDIHQDMMRLALEIAAKTLFGADIGDEAREIGSALHVVLEQFDARSYTAFLIPPYVPTPLNLRARKAVRSLDEIVYGIIRRRRASRSSNGDLLSMLLEAQDEDGNRMTDRQLRDEAITLLLAGHETTAIALSWAWYLLAQNPEVEAKLLAELRATLGGRTPAFEDIPRLQYADKVVRESMRLYPPAWMIGREAAADCELGGYLVPAGAQMYMSQWVMHRDPRYFAEPERFHPDRWTPEFSRRLPKFAYFPFGGGPRVCIGAAFAMMEATLLLATIAQRFRVTLVPGQRVEPWPSVTLRPRNGVHVVVARR